MLVDEVVAGALVTIVPQHATHLLQTCFVTWRKDQINRPWIRIEKNNVVGGFR
jgi:hypothetical protein